MAPIDHERSGHVNAFLDARPGADPSGGAYWPDLKGLDAMSRLMC